MCTDPRFVPIAERHLVFVGPDLRESPLDVAIGPPYRPAMEEAMRAYAACLVWTNDDPALFTEVFGADEMEALIAGLEFIERHLTMHVTLGGGVLKTIEGNAFDPAGSFLLQGRLNSPP